MTRRGCIASMLAGRVSGPYFPLDRLIDAEPERDMVVEGYVYGTCQWGFGGSALAAPVRVWSNYRSINKSLI